MARTKKPRPLVDYLEWIPVGHRMPDDETTVLIAIRGGSEPVWLGWHEEDIWHYVDGTFVAETGGEVTHWTDVPKGPDNAF